MGLDEHRLSGSLQISLYNAVMSAEVESLAEFMLDFQQRYSHVIIVQSASCNRVSTIV